MNTQTKAVALGAAAVLSWSTVATAFKVALANTTPYGMLFVACATSLLIFAAWLTATRGWGGLRRLKPAVWGRFALLGAVAPTAYYLVLFKAYDYLPAQVAQPINYAWPIVLAVMLAVFAHKPIPPMKYLGMAVSLAGVVCISMGGGGVDGSLSAVGIGLAALSALLWALYWILNNTVADKVEEPVALFLTFAFGMAYLLAGTLVSPLPALSAKAIWAGAYVGAFEMGVPFICFGMALRLSDNPALINQMCYLSPFLSLFFIAMVLGETIVPATYVGLALIVGGLAFNELIGRRIGVRH